MSDLIVKEMSSIAIEMAREKMDETDWIAAGTKATVAMTNLQDPDDLNRCRSGNQNQSPNRGNHSRSPSQNRKNRQFPKPEFHRLASMSDVLMIC